MTEYIEREKVVSKFEAIKNRGVSLKDAIYLDGVMAVLDTIPAADVAEVRHGRWIEDERTYPGPGLKNNLCSVCGEIAGSWKEGLEPGRKWAYCPNCGARMDKEDEHEAG